VEAREANFEDMISTRVDFQPKLPGREMEYKPVDLAALLPFQPQNDRMLLDESFATVAAEVPGAEFGAAGGFRPVKAMKTRAQRDAETERFSKTKPEGDNNQ